MEQEAFGTEELGIPSLTTRRTKLKDGTLRCIVAVTKTRWDPEKKRPYSAETMSVGVIANNQEFGPIIFKEEFLQQHPQLREVTVLRKQGRQYVYIKQPLSAELQGYHKVGRKRFEPQAQVQSPSAEMSAGGTEGSAEGSAGGGTAGSGMGAALKEDNFDLTNLYRTIAQSYLIAPCLKAVLGDADATQILEAALARLSQKQDPTWELLTATPPMNVPLPEVTDDQLRQYGLGLTQFLVTRLKLNPTFTLYSLPGTKATLALQQDTSFVGCLKLKVTPEEAPTLLRQELSAQFGPAQLTYFLRDDEISQARLDTLKAQGIDVICPLPPEVEEAARYYAVTQDIIEGGNSFEYDPSVHHLTLPYHLSWDEGCPELAVHIFYDPLRYTQIINQCYSVGAAILMAHQSNSYDQLPQAYRALDQQIHLVTKSPGLGDDTTKRWRIDNQVLMAHAQSASIWVLGTTRPDLDGASLLWLHRKQKALKLSMADLEPKAPPAQILLSLVSYQLSQALRYNIAQAKRGQLGPKPQLSDLSFFNQLEQFAGIMR